MESDVNVLTYADPRDDDPLERIVWLVIYAGLLASVCAAVRVSAAFPNMTNALKSHHRSWTTTLSIVVELGVGISVIVLLFSFCGALLRFRVLSSIRWSAAAASIMTMFQLIDGIYADTTNHRSFISSCVNLCSRLTYSIPFLLIVGVLAIPKIRRLQMWADDTPEL